MGRCFRPFNVLLFVIVITAAVVAQVRVDVRLVNVVATVTDANGRYVPGLKAEDFVVQEDGVEQKIAHFSHDRDIPVSVGITLDTSGSMERKIRTAIDAVDRFIRTVHKEDEIFLMTFSGQPDLRQEFTDDRDKLSRALQRIRVNGGTALYDALDESLSVIRSAHHDKRAILLITDGQDTSSALKFEDVLQAVRESELLVYSLGISPTTFGQRTEHVPFTWPVPPILSGGGRSRSSTQRDNVDMDILQSFADNSGGRAFLVSESWMGGRGTEIDKILTRVAEELRSQYTIGYYPPRPDDGRFHSIKVTTKQGHFVRARRGYIARGS